MMDRLRYGAPLCQAFHAKLRAVPEFPWREVTSPSAPACLPVPLAQREGVGGLYKGLAPNVLRVMPQSALTFLVYESVMRLLQQQQP